MKKQKKLAKETDGGEFKEDGVGDWEYDRVEDEKGNVLDCNNHLRSCTRKYEQMQRMFSL